MALSHITSPDAVLAAIAEYDRLGRDQFLAKYGFGEARATTSTTTARYTTPRPSWASHTATKISNLNPGFWGLNTNQIQALDRARVSWFVVLLFNTPDKGFVLSSEDVKHAIIQKRWSLSDAGDYKVHEHELAPKNRFSNFNAITSRIL